MRIAMLISMLGLYALVFGAAIACDHPSTYYDPNTGKIWSVSDDGVVQTNDFQRLQKATPFRIVLPSYVPSDLASCPLVFTKTVGTYAQKDVQVKFSYTNERNAITVEETNFWPLLEPNNEMNPLHLVLNGSDVVQETFKKFLKGGSQDIAVDVYGYTWQRQGVGFVVDVQGYLETEARKVIESMIR